MIVKCEIMEIELEGDYGPVDSFMAICSRCGKTTGSFGTHDASRRRCLVLMRDECLRGENNYYVDEEDSDFGWE